LVFGINEQTTSVGAFVSDGNGTVCNGVQVVNSVFDGITAQAIIGDNAPSNLVGGIISAGNTYRNVGSGLVNAIDLSGDNCYSIGDIFPSTPLTVNFNDKKCFATLPNGQLRLGTQHYVGGRDIALPRNTPAYALAGVVGFKNYPTIVEYTVIRYGEQRVGSLKIAPVGSTIAYSDDYVETADSGVILKPQLSADGATVELYYSAGNESVLKIASRTLTGIDHVPAPVLHAPDAPTNVTVTLVLVPVASFTKSTGAGDVPFNVTFTDTSTNTPTSWLWDFGDGATSTAQNPVHTYSVAGSYNVTLTATNTAGSNTSAAQVVVASVPVIVPVASFTKSTGAGDVPFNVTFTDTSTNTPTSWLWDFGDGGTSTAQNPVHTYSVAGSYNVTLTATNTAGSNTSAAQVVVASVPVPVLHAPDAPTNVTVTLASQLF
jgi:PKD repeat protein